MRKGSSLSTQKSNLLLDALLPETRARVLSLAKEVKLPLRTLLQEQDALPKYAYFMTSGFASVVVHLPEGGAAEVALIGHEGVVGNFALMGPSLASTVCFVQLAGSGYQIRFSDLQKLFRESEDLRDRVLENAQVQALTTNQLAACNKLHEAEARLARWLLMVRDRVQDDYLPLTQEFLAEMLGTRRTTVALAAGALQQAGIIQYSRGRVKILSVEDLATVACDCYVVAKRLFDGLYKKAKEASDV